MNSQRQRTNIFFAAMFLAIVFVFQITFAQGYVNKKILIKPPRGQNYFNGHEYKNDRSFKMFKSADNPSYSFSASVQVNEDPNDQINDYGPAIAVPDSGTVYVVWTGDETNKSVLFSRSTDGRTTFSSAVKINDDVAYPPSYSVYQPDIALDSEGNIYVVWFDYRAWIDDSYQYMPIDIYLDKSTDGGVTWGTDVKATDGTGYYLWNFQPYIAINKKNNYIYVSFTNYDRYYTLGDLGDISVVCSKDKGQTFGPAVRVDDTNDTLLVVQNFSSIAVDSSSGNVYVAFEDSRHTSKDIYLAKSIDNGQTFLANQLVNDDTTNDQEEPAMKVDNSGNVYVIWKDWRADTSETQAPYFNDLYIGKSTDNGESFNSNIKINDQNLKDEYSFNYPSRLAIDNSNNIHVTWFDSRLGYTNCFYDESTDGGQTFGTDVIVNDNHDTLSHALPRIDVDNKKGVYVVWMDTRVDTNYDIYFSKRIDGNLPVEMTSFSASVQNNFVELNWTTATELNNYGYEVEKRPSPTPSKGEGAFGSPIPLEGGQGVGWIKIGFVNGNGNSVSTKSYSFTEKSTEYGKYQYRLKQIDFDGAFTYSKIVEVNIVSPNKFELLQNYPNPFNPTTIIKYSIPASLNPSKGGTLTQLKIYDILGNEVAMLVNKEQQPGSYEFEFNASNLSSGVYFYRLQAGNFIQMKKMIFLK